MFSILADLVWPALFLSNRLSAWWCIAASLLLEAVALWRFARIHPVKAFGASMVMNAVSAFCGSLLLPMLGLQLETLANLTYNRWFGWGTFNAATYVATWLAAVALTTLIEMFVLWLVFCMPWTRRLTVVVFLANAATVALAFVSMLVFASK